MTEIHIETSSYMVGINIGKEPRGYSTVLHYEDSEKIVHQGTTYFDGQPNRLCTVRFKIYPWFVSVTDPDVLNKLTGKPKSEWSDIILNEMFKLLSGTQMLTILKSTWNIAHNEGHKSGRESKMNEIQEVLGLI